MLRSFLIYLSKSLWMQKLVTNWGYASRIASRFIAGIKLEEAMRVVRELNAKGINATLDHLGEHTNTPEEAQQATDDIFATLDALGADSLRGQHSTADSIGFGLTKPVRPELERILACKTE